MKFLTKFGQIALKTIGIITGFAPLAEMAVPGQAANIQVVSADLAQLADIITQVEIVGQTLSLAGPDKLKAAAPQIAQVILKSSMLANHTIADPDLFNQGCTKVADGMADILNSLHDNISVQNKT